MNESMNGWDIFKLYELADGVIQQFFKLMDYIEKQILSWIAGLITNLPYTTKLSRLVDRIIVEIERDNV